MLCHQVGVTEIMALLVLPYFPYNFTNGFLIVIRNFQKTDFNSEADSVQIVILFKQLFRIINFL